MPIHQERLQQDRGHSSPQAAPVHGQSYQAVRRYNPTEDVTASDGRRRHNFKAKRLHYASLGQLITVLKRNTEQRPAVPALPAVAPRTSQQVRAHQPHDAPRGSVTQPKSRDNPPRPLAAVVREQDAPTNAAAGVTAWLANERAAVERQAAVANQAVRAAAETRQAAARTNLEPRQGPEWGGEIGDSSSTEGPPPEELVQGQTRVKLAAEAAGSVGKKAGTLKLGGVRGSTVFDMGENGLPEITLPSASPVSAAAAAATSPQLADIGHQHDVLDDRKKIRLKVRKRGVEGGDLTEEQPVKKVELEEPRRPSTLFGPPSKLTIAHEAALAQVKDLQDRNMQLEEENKALQSRVTFLALEASDLVTCLEKTVGVIGEGLTELKATRQKLALEHTAAKAALELAKLRQEGDQVTDMEEDK